ncbi:cell division topological specificity factor MinE [Methylocaldum szegediense]|uniref:Cell division topological specificity factor n=1 Tax=Methylocaldum szegediense TaxID=73780 RepID=A0ABN8X4Q9_9GAMM|nr:cell division topological specificity factor MinE [Methylocaldum szegediense]CAI8875399.1 Z-ring positioning protein MinE [Methylocaldum szegediense]
MGLLDYFRSSRPSSAAIAKERLQILVAHERSQRSQPEYLTAMKKDLLEVIRKYVNVDQNAITVSMEKDENREILELNIVLPEDSEHKRHPRR